MKPKYSGSAASNKLEKNSKTEHLGRELTINQRLDLTETQKEIIDAALDKNVRAIILSGSPGTAKSYTSILAGLMLLNKKRADQLIYIRSLIQSRDGATGFLAGSLEEKTFYVNQPLYCLMEEMISPADVEYLKKDNRILTYPTSMLRSYTFKNSVIISEETQNMTLDSGFSILTRAGMYSKVFLIGDPSTQNDLGSESGFKKLVDIFSDQESYDMGFRVFHLTSKDIVRSPFVKFVVEKFEKCSQRNENGEWRPKS